MYHYKKRGFLVSLGIFLIFYLIIIVFNGSGNGITGKVVEENLAETVDNSSMGLAIPAFSENETISELEITIPIISENQTLINEENLPEASENETDTNLILPLIPIKENNSLEKDTAADYVNTTIF